MNLSKNLKYCRIKKKLTQKQVAKILCVSRKTVSGWENSRSFPDINSLVKLSTLYNISVDSLLKDSQLLDEYSEQHNYLTYSKKISMIFYYINILLCTTVLLGVFNYRGSYTSTVPIFLIINITAFFSHFSSWTRFKNRPYALVSLTTFITIFVISIISNIQMLQSSAYILQINKNTLLGFLLGRFLLIFGYSLSLVVILFFNPKAPLLKKAPSKNN